MSFATYHSVAASPSETVRIGEPVQVTRGLLVLVLVLVLVLGLGLMLVLVLVLVLRLRLVLGLVLG